MGILDKLLTAQVPAGVSSLNTLEDAVALAASSPLNLAPAGQTLNLTFVLTNQARGDLVVRGPASWTRKAAGAMGTILTANGAGGDLTYAPITVAGGPLAHSYDGTTHVFAFTLAGEANGDLLTRIGGVWARLGAGAVGSFLRAAGPGSPIAWSIGDVFFAAGQNIALDPDETGIKYGSAYVLFYDGTDLTLGGPSGVSQAMVIATSTAGLSANGGFQLTAQVGKIALFDSTLGAGNGVNVVPWKNATTAPNAGVTNAAVVYVTGGALKAMTAAGAIEHMVSPWGSSGVATRFVAITSGGAVTAQLNMRSLTINGTSVNVLTP